MHQGVEARGLLVQCDVLESADAPLRLSLRIVDQGPRRLDARAGAPVVDPVDLPREGDEDPARSVAHRGHRDRIFDRVEEGLAVCESSAPALGVELDQGGGSVSAEHGEAQAGRGIDARAARHDDLSDEAARFDVDDGDGGIRKLIEDGEESVAIEERRVADGAVAVRRHGGKDGFADDQEALRVVHGHEVDALPSRPARVGDVDRVDLAPLS
jgi:hypothetical protein